MRVPSFLVFVSVLVFFGCGDDDVPADDSDGGSGASSSGGNGIGGNGASGGGSGNAGPVYVDGDGFPELTGPLTHQGSASAGDTLMVGIPVDADTAWVRLAIEDYATSTTLVQNEADEGGPSTTVSIDIEIPVGTSAPPGTYYMTVELCSSATCVDPFKRVVYERLGQSTTYGRTDFDSPPLVQVGNPYDSAVPIQTFELQ